MADFRPTEPFADLSIYRNAVRDASRGIVVGTTAFSAVGFIVQTIVKVAIMASNNHEFEP
jgi:hypothetical protein